MDMPCSGCGTAVKFDHDGSWASVCTDCYGLVRRSGERLGAGMRTMPIVQDLSPMRVGTIGKHDGREFRITGRIRVEGDNGYRNYWSLKGRDLPYRWLVHAYGNYALMQKGDRALETKAIRGIKPTATLKMEQDHAFIIEMLDSAFRFAWEGEIMEALSVPFAIEVEAGHQPDAKLLVHMNEAKQVEHLIGVTVEFADLHFENAPQLGQWT